MNDRPLGRGHDTGPLSLSDSQPTRRTFLLTGTTAAAGVAYGRLGGARGQSMLQTLRALAQPRQDSSPVITLRDARIKALVARALDAAKSAGAQYADVRVTNTRGRAFFADTVNNSEAFGLSVRALIDGVWGFASSPYLMEDEAPRLGKLATANAKSIAQAGGALGSARSGTRAFEWGTIPIVQNGDWTTPIQIDPFEVAEVEILDWLHGLQDFARDYVPLVGGEVDAVFINSRPPVSFTKQERVMASTEGSYLIQTLYTSDIDLKLNVKKSGTNDVASLPGTGSYGAGWECVSAQSTRIRDAIPEIIAKFDADRELPVEMLEIGRYDIVFSASAMAEVVSHTLGTATELDRAVGYEANATGTSYLGPDPHAVLGTAVAAPLVTITANRSVPRGLATVQWDDEGVAPHEFTLVEQGTLVDYQTTREQAAWLAPWYQKQRTPIQSRGCAWAPSAQELPMQHTSNLTLQAGSGSNDLNALVAGMSQGLEVGTFDPKMDWQCLNGLGFASDIYKIERGKRVARFRGEQGFVGVMFRSPEFWKNVIALGGVSSAELIGLDRRSKKGEPTQSVDYSVSAVPAVIKQLAVLDPTKKA